MKKNTLWIVLIAVIVLAVLAGAGYYFLAPKPAPSTSTVAVVDKLLGWKFPGDVKFPSTGSVGGPIAYSSIRDPGGIPQGLPVRLQIPIIGVDSAIEDALITPDGRMDVPAGTIDVAWFALGPHPGQVGSAVIGGHYGIQNGVPFVFYKLNTLKIGDKAYIIDDGGNTLTFIVRTIKSFARTADATTVFTSTDGLAHLNLITCEGIWNQVNGNYPDRLVIFMDLIPTTGAAATSTVSATAPTGTTTGAAAQFTRSLGIGASGSDVIELQTFLEQRGLLQLPPGVVNGYFGALTASGLGMYQTSVGLSAVGVLGPLTRVKINAELASGLTLPSTGTVPVTPATVAADRAASEGTVTSSASSALMGLVTSVFATPVDILITILLLCAIACMIYLIIRTRNSHR